MKIIHPATVRTLVLAATSALCLQAANPSARAGEEAAESEFPYLIQFELGAAEFAPGDSMVITSVRGNQKHFESGGRYLVEGSYTLAAADGADLALHTTSRGPSGPSPVMDDQHVEITRGSGNFHLKKTLRDDGWLHLSFYVNGHSHGGIYFGEKGVEKTVLRKKGWSDFSSDSARAKPGREFAAGESAGALTNDANLAILAYLGNPVPAPADLDAKYNRTNLRAAFTVLSKKAALRVKALEVDESEFPFLAYGVLAGKCDFQVLEKGLREMNGYAYGGSVVGHTDQGATYFALNMVPHDQYPSDRCDRRLMIRLQMLADTARRTE